MLVRVQVSMQLQSTVDQVKTLKASLAETTKALEKTDNTVKSRDSDLKKAKADGEALQKRVRPRTAPHYVILRSIAYHYVMFSKGCNIPDIQYKILGLWPRKLRICWV